VTGRLFPTEALSIQDIILHRLKVGATEHIGAHMLESMEVSLGQDDYFLDRLVMRLKAYVLAERLPPASVTKTVTVSWVKPATWRDHWKLTFGHRWWARWYVSRRPARTVELRQDVALTVDLQKYITYPKANVPFRDSAWRPVRAADWITSDRTGHLYDA
jgi:hypothetical protein